MARTTKKIERREDWYKVYVKIQNTTMAEYINVDTSFDTLRSQLDSIENEHGDTYSKFKIEVTTELEYYGTESTQYYVYGWRHETDKEFEARCADQVKRDTQVADHELKEYNRLAKKYG